MRKIVAIRVDVDTSVGLKKGVQKLLEIFSRHGVLATFFVVMGPDTMGKHAKRFKKKNYFKRIRKVNPFKLIRSYGIAPFLYGTLLPSPLIGEAHPEILKMIIAQGHEVGLHGYDHARWADSYCDSMSENDVQEDFEKAYQAYSSALGKVPAGFAAPNWRCDEKIFGVEDKYELLYGSDLRGQYPFFPEVNGITFRTLQIPVTLPCTHECIQAGIPKTKVVEHIASKLTDKINIWTIHDWYEGLSESEFVEQFIRLARKQGYSFKKIEYLAGKILQQPEKIMSCQIEKRPIEGGIGEVTCQLNQGVING